MGVTHSVATSNTGTCTVTAAANTAANVAWNLSSLIVSMSGGTIGPNAKLNVWDGAVGSGTLLFSVFVASPGTGSVGTTQEIPLPLTPDGKTRSLQGSPGNAMNIQVVGTGGNTVIINARLTDGLPIG